MIDDEFLDILVKSRVIKVCNLYMFNSNTL